ncbi:MAG: spore protease YyaC [Candidatus Coproplasma sp.]
MDFSFNLYNSLAPGGVFTVLKKTVPIKGKLPVIVCVGSDLSVGDSLGPVTGTKLLEKLKGANVYVYGTLSKPITAHEVKYMSSFLSNTHPGCPVIAIDAAVGVAGDIGLIKVANRPLSPGSGANKRLNKIGEASILGIVAEKSLFNYSLFSSTRLNVIYKMADIISEGVAMYLQDCIQSILLNERLAHAAPSQQTAL